MTGKAKKEILDIIRYISPEVYNYAVILYNDIESRPDPQPGDRFDYGEKVIVFDKIMFDGDYKHGVAFNYIFHEEGDPTKIITIHSINCIEDKDYILTVNEIRDMYGFWKYTYPIDND